MRKSVLVIALAFSIGCNGPVYPTGPTTSSAPISPPPPPPPPQPPPVPTGPGIVTVEVADFSEWPPRGCGFCSPQLPERMSLDGMRVQSFANSGVLVWDGVGDDVHTLRILGGDYGGPVICGFWFDPGWKQTKEIVVENGKSTPVTVRFDCT
jgi:hypothetical protein